MTLSHRCDSLKGHGDLLGQALLVGLGEEHRTETFAMKPATARLRRGAGCGRATLAGGGRGQKQPGLVSYQRESVLPEPPALGWSLTTVQLFLLIKHQTKSHHYRPAAFEPRRQPKTERCIGGSSLSSR